MLLFWMLTQVSTARVPTALVLTVLHEAFVKCLDSHPAVGKKAPALCSTTCLHVPGSAGLGQTSRADSFCKLCGNSTNAFSSKNASVLLIPALALLECDVQALWCGSYMTVI